MPKSSLQRLCDLRPGAAQHHGPGRCSRGDRRHLPAGEGRWRLAGSRRFFLCKGGRNTDEEKCRNYCHASFLPENNLLIFPSPLQ